MYKWNKKINTHQIPISRSNKTCRCPHVGRNYTKSNETFKLHQYRGKRPNIKTEKLVQFGLKNWSIFCNEIKTLPNEKVILTIKQHYNLTK